jgi:predicted small metal-binding protein
VNGRLMMLRCDCGFEVQADGEEDLVAGVQRHALEAHGMPFSPEEVLELAARAELGDGAGPSHSETGP